MGTRYTHGYVDSGGGVGSGEYTLGLNEKLILDDDGVSYWTSETDDEASLYLGGTQRLLAKNSASPALEVFGSLKVANDRFIGSVANPNMLRMGTTFLTSSADFIPSSDGGSDLGLSSFGWGALHMNGLIHWDQSANEQTTVGSAGGASSLPASPDKYLKVVDSAGATLVIPAFAAS